MLQDEYSKLEKQIGFTFKNRKVLVVAFTHRSYLNENDEDAITSNERLEFLGDAILQFLTSEFIYKKYEAFPEGRLTNLRSRLVNTESLAAEAIKYDLGEYLLISRGEKETAKQSKNILADTFEALIGAIFIDTEIETCRQFLENHLFYKADEILSAGSLKDAKSLYQEFTQEKYATTPSYRVMNEFGPDHDKHFEVGVYIEGKLVAKGKGPSKQSAEQAAAQKALKSEN